MTNRGQLLESARAVVCENGYVFKKGHSRSKKCSTASTTACTPKRPKLTQEVRKRRIEDLKDEIEDLTKSISFKERRVSASANVKNFKACDLVQQEITACKSTRRELITELRVFENKDRRSRAYHAARDGSSGSRVPSPESPRRRIFESPSPSPPLSDGSMMYSDSRSSTSASPAFSTPVHLTSPPFLPLPCSFSEEEVQKFETRLEEGFDIPDKRYAMWLRVNKLEKFAAARKGRSNSLPTHDASLFNSVVPHMSLDTSYESVAMHSDPTSPVGPHTWSDPTSLGDASVSVGPHTRSDPTSLGDTSVLVGPHTV